MPKEIHLKDYNQPNFWCHSVELEVDIFEDSTIVKCIGSYKLNKNKLENDSTLFLNGVGLILKDVKVNDKKYSEDNYSLSLDSLELKSLPEEFRLETVVEINPLD